MTHLAYRIHSKKSIQSRSLVLELVAAERGPMGWDLGDTLDFKAAAQCELQAVDREIIRSMRAEASVSELLPLLARTGRLFFGAKSIVVNLHKPWQLALKVDGDLEEGFLIEGALCDDKKRVPLADCPLLVMGRPSYALVGPTLRPIEEDIFPQYLQALWPDGSLMVEGNEAQAWLRRLEQEERPDSLLLEMPEGLQRRQERGLEPLPRLRLTDPKGAFAQLAMCYGEVELDAEDPRKRFDCAGQRYDRQFEAERHWEKDLLETAYRKQQVGEAAYYCPLDQVGKSLSFLLELGWDVRDAQGMRVCKSQGKVEAAMRSAKDTLLVQGRVRFDAHEADLKDVLGAFNRRESFVSIGDGMVALLDSGLGEQLLPLIEGGELVQAGVKVPRHAFGLLDGLDSIQPADRASGELCSLLKGDSATVHPTDLQAELRPYQQEGLRWMHARGQAGLSCLLADDMGLGKTVQVLGLISLLPQDAKVLVVMPTSLLFNWQAEAGRFLPGRPVHVHYGSERGEAFAPGITLTSYAILRRDADILRNTTWDLLVLDEAQMIKNPTTQTAQAAFGMRAGLRISMTGTPVENRLEELWSQFRFLAPGLLGSREEFAASALAGQSDSRYLRRIHKQVSPFILRRKKEEVASDLPEKIEQLVWVEMSEAQRRFYENFLASARAGILQKVASDGMGRHRMEVLETLLRLRQICCHPLLVGQLAEADCDSAKLRILRDDLETLMQEGKKVLVYSQFTSMLQLMKRELGDLLPQTYYLDGGTRDRGGEVAAFQECEGPAVFFISLKAGGVGINLSAADYVYLYDPWWNQALEAQAIDRAHRIGRRDTVVAKRLIARETVEEKILQLKARKSQLAEGVLGADFSDTSLSIEDLEFLLA